MSSIYLPPTSSGNGLILAFSGKMRAGKEEAMKYLNFKYFNDNAFGINFADPLYTLCSTIQAYCGFPIGKDRELLQFIGTDYGRAHNPDVWINKLFGDIECFHRDKTVLIGDVRFTNEAVACKTRNVVVIRINATEEIRLARGADPDRLTHVSETDLDNYTDFDFMVDNNGTLAEFHAALDVIFGDVLTLMTGLKSKTSLPSGSPLKIELIDDVLAQNSITSGVRITASGLYLPS